jgi:hypothetical protein
LSLNAVIDGGFAALPGGLCQGVEIDRLAGLDFSPFEKVG